MQRFGQRVVLALVDCAKVFRAEVLAEGVKDRLQGSGTFGGQIAVQLARAAEGSP